MDKYYYCHLSGDYNGLSVLLKVPDPDYRTDLYIKSTLWLLFSFTKVLEILN